MQQASFPRKDIDYERCTTPFACKVCLQICPQAVFFVTPVKLRKYQETDPHEPGSFYLRPLFRDKCTACMDCVKACPEHALVVKAPAATRASG